MVSKKKQGWEKKLSDFIEAAKGVPFKRGSHDCAWFAGKAIDLMTDQDTTSEFIGDYKSKKAAYEFLKQIGYDGLAAVATAKLGEPLQNINYAGRGDCVLINYESQEALGIIDLSGRRAVSVTNQGLHFFDLKSCVQAWKV